MTTRGRRPGIDHREHIGQFSRTESGLYKPRYTHQDLDRLIDELSNRPTASSGGGVRSATVVVAAENAYDRSKELADFVCTGIDDQDTINEAYAIGAGYPGGKVVLTEGFFNISGPLEPYEETTTEGYGVNNTIIEAGFGFPAGTPMVRSSDGGTDSPFNLTFRHFTINGGVFAQDIFLFKQGSQLIFEDLDIFLADRYGIGLITTAFDHDNHLIRRCLIGTCGTAGIYISTMNRGHITQNISNSPFIFEFGADGIVSENSIWPNDVFGIKLDGSGSMTVHDNRIYNPFQDAGILLVNGAFENSIQANVIRADTGIDIAAACNDNFMTTNDLLNTTTAISDLGTGNVKIHNRGDDI